MKNTIELQTRHLPAPPIPPPEIKAVIEYDVTGMNCDQRQIFMARALAALALCEKNIIYPNNLSVEVGALHRCELCHYPFYQDAMFARGAGMPGLICGGCHDRLNS